MQLLSPPLLSSILTRSTPPVPPMVHSASLYWYPHLHFWLELSCHWIRRLLAVPASVNLYLNRQKHKRKWSNGLINDKTPKFSNQTSQQWPLTTFSALLSLSSSSFYTLPASSPLPPLPPLLLLSDYLSDIWLQVKQWANPAVASVCEAFVPLLIIALM